MESGVCALLLGLGMDILGRPERVVKGVDCFIYKMKNLSKPHMGSRWSLSNSSVMWRWLKKIEIDV